MPLPTEPKSRAISVTDVSRAVWHLGLFSLAALVFAFPLAHAAWIPPVCGGVACASGFVGLFTALWCAWRMHSVQIVRAALPAAFAVVGWIVFAVWYIAGG